jgi:hypothetical protein
MSESVQIVLEGVDKASAIFDKVGQRADAYSKKMVSILDEEIMRMVDGEKAAERFKLSAMGLKQEQIEAIETRRETIATLQAEAKAAEDAAEKTRQQEQATADLQKYQEDYLENLRLEELALTQGAGAVEEYRLRKRGASEATIEEAKGIRASIEAKKQEVKASEALAEAERRATAEKRIAGKAAKELGSALAGMAAQFGAGEIGGFVASLGMASKKLEELQADTDKSAASVGVMKVAIGLMIAESIMPLVNAFARAVTGQQGFEKQMQHTQEQMGREHQFYMRMLDERFNKTLQIIQLQDSDQAKKEMATAEAERLDKLITEYNKKWEEAKKASEEAAGTMLHSVRVGEARQKHLDNEVKTNREMLDLYKSQYREATKIRDAQFDEVEIAKKKKEIRDQETAAFMKAEDIIKGYQEEARKLLDADGEKKRNEDEFFQAGAGVEAFQRTDLEAARAELDAAKLKVSLQNLYKEAVKESEEINKQNAEEVKKQAESEAKYLSDLRVKNIELRNGAEAAEREKEALAGMSEETKKQAAELRKQNEELELQNKIRDEGKKRAEDIIAELAKGTPENQAKEGRMLTRGGGGTPADRTAKATEEQLKLQQATIKALQEMSPLFQDIKDNTAKQIKVIR